MNGTITVLIADGHEMMRESLSLLLGRDPDLTVVGVASDGPSALTMAATMRPQVVLLDASLPKIDGVATSRRIREAAPDAGLVLFSAHDGAQLLKDFLKDDPSGKAFLLTSSLNSTRDLIRTIADVASGRTVIDPAMISKLTINQSVNMGSSLNGLTQREIQVLSLMARAHTNRSVAEVLFIQPRTVEHHISSILSKLGLQAEGEYHGRVRAVLTYLDAIGQLPPGSDYAPAQSAAPSVPAIPAGPVTAFPQPVAREVPVHDFQRRQTFAQLQGRVA